MQKRISKLSAVCIYRVQSLERRKYKGINFSINESKQFRFSSFLNYLRYLPPTPLTKASLLQLCPPDRFLQPPGGGNSQEVWNSDVQNTVLGIQKEDSCSLIQRCFKLIKSNTGHTAVQDAHRH